VGSCPRRPARQARHVGRLRHGIFTDDEHTLGSPIPFYLYVDVGHRAVVCGCRPSCRYFLQVFETFPCRGGSTEIFN
jgi:hypothetical protein